MEPIVSPSFNRPIATFSDLHLKRMQSTGHRDTHKAATLELSLKSQVFGMTDLLSQYYILLSTVFHRSTWAAMIVISFMSTTAHPNDWIRARKHSRFTGVDSNIGRTGGRESPY